DRTGTMDIPVTDRFRFAMHLANREAMRWNHSEVDTEHVLLGLIKSGTCGAVKVMKHLNMETNPRAIRREIEQFVRAGGEVFATGRLPLKMRVENVLQQAMQEARLMQSDATGTEHLLLGLLHEDDGVASFLLAGYGMTLERAREVILELRCCPDCKGSGQYVGLSVVESCRRCAGSGKVELVSA
ncbi:MAG: hypothetical protein N2C14_13240, partial [Planctomycetales bacterium]